MSPDFVGFYCGHVASTHHSLVIFLFTRLSSASGIYLIRVYSILLRLHVIQLRTPNSSSILRTNSDPTPRLDPKLPIGMTLYHSISNPQIPPLLPDMSSLSYFLFEHCFTLPYLLFPALPSVMPVCSNLLISEFPASPSRPIGLSLYVHKTFRTWIVLCSFFCTDFELYK